MAAGVKLLTAYGQEERRGGAGMEHGAQSALKKRQGEVDAGRGGGSELRRAGSLVLSSAGSYICTILLQFAELPLPQVEH